ncbi:MAG TPA: NlpC/P60 family protein [Streptosporangiaceae bacterium]
MRTPLPGIRTRLRGTVAIAAAAAAATGIAVYTGTAGAAPQPSVSQVQQEVNQAQSKYDQANQTYDQAVQDYSAAKAKLSRLNGQVAVAQKNFTQMRADVAQIAAQSYENSNMNSIAALLTSNNPQAVLNQGSLLLELSGTRNQEMSQFLADAQQLNTDQQKVRAGVTTLAALKAKATGQKQQASQALASKQATLASLTAPVQQAVASASIGAGGTTSAVYTGTTATQAGKAVAFVYAQLGKPYAWGATGPDAYDCSGLVQAAWAAAGVSIPRTTYDMWASLPHVSSSSLAPGDLILIGGESHVVMYVGGGEIIDAPQTGSSVERVPLAGWYVSNEDGVVRP